MERHAGGSHVHCCSIKQVRCPALPLRHHHGYAADLHRGLPADIHMPAQEFPVPVMNGNGYAPLPAHIRQI